MPKFKFFTAVVALALAAGCASVDTPATAEGSAPVAEPAAETTAAAAPEPTEAPAAEPEPAAPVATEPAAAPVTEPAPAPAAEPAPEAVPEPGGEPPEPGAAEPTAGRTGGGLVIAPEGARPSPLPDRPRWTDNVDRTLGWRTADCKFAYYAVGPKDCSGNVHRDHLVAWAEAWDSGLSYAAADAWYLDVDNLYVMPAGENISKSDEDPAEWRPQDPADWCRYASDWVAVKLEWGLTADRAEADALDEMLSTCGGQPSPAVAEAPTTTAPEAPTTAAPETDPDPEPDPPADTTDTDLDERLQEIRSTPCGKWTAEDRALARQAPDGFDWGRRDGDGDGNPCDV